MNVSDVLRGYTMCGQLMSYFCSIGEFFVVDSLEWNIQERLSMFFRGRVTACRRLV